MHKVSNQKKYRIDELLDKLSIAEYRRAMSVIPKKLNVSKRTFQNWKAIPMGSKTQIPGDHLLTMCDFFEIEVREMYTTPPKRMSMDERKELLKAKTISNII